MADLKIPSNLLPVGVLVVSMAVAWGSTQFAVADNAKETARIEKIVIETSKKAQANGQAQAVTETKLKAIVESLNRQEKTAEKTNEQIQALVQVLLSQQK
jgi:hypothetical protein